MNVSTRASHFAELQLKRDSLPVQYLKDWETQVKAFTDIENATADVPRLVWRRDVRLGVNHELHTVCRDTQGLVLSHLFCSLFIYMTIVFT